jgi:hypothetical protein
MGSSDRHAKPASSGPSFARGEFEQTPLFLGIHHEIELAGPNLRRHWEAILPPFEVGGMKKL